MRVLIVDDDKIIRMGLRKLLNRLFEQHEVVCDFQNGKLALDYLKEHGGEVDLVITDIKMPVMTGIELIEKAIREIPKPPIFVVLSGFDEFTYVRDTMKFGAFNYLLKPIKKDDLINLINEVEQKLVDKDKSNKIYNKSIELLKKDFFKKILFSNNDNSSKLDNALLENIQLDETYIYQMIVVPIKKDDKENKSRILGDYIKGIITKYSKIEYLYFYYEDNIYIIFYFSTVEYRENLLVLNSIVEDTGIFIENEKDVIIFKSTNKVWELKRQSRVVKKIKEGITDNYGTKKLFVEDPEKLLHIFAEEDIKQNATSIRLAIDYIQKNYNKDISLKDVADEVYLSQNYLSELFKRETGKGFYEYLSNYRIKKAKEMLITTNLKIYEVAQNVGYNDSITFGRAFKKITGSTPNGFRNNKIEV